MHSKSKIEARHGAVEVARRIAAACCAASALFLHTVTGMNGRRDNAMATIANTDDRRVAEVAEVAERDAAGEIAEELAPVDSARARHASHSGPAEQNIQAVARLERKARLKRSLAACVSDGITGIAGNEWSVAAHALWFSIWLLVNSAVSPWKPFDPFPFSLLTSIVSLEAIFLTLFVLASQNRLTTEADKRAHLDLQVNLLAEQEMTVVLRMLKDLCDHFDLTSTTRSEEFRDLIARTDIRDLAERVEQNLQPERREPSSQGAGT
jgi:uncharacterized membrane protein